MPRDNDATSPALQTFFSTQMAARNTAQHHSEWAWATLCLITLHTNFSWSVPARTLLSRDYSEKARNKLQTNRKTHRFLAQNTFRKNSSTARKQHKSNTSLRPLCHHWQTHFWSNCRTSQEIHGKHKQSIYEQKISEPFLQPNPDTNKQERRQSQWLPKQQSRNLKKAIATLDVRNT